MSNPGCQIGWLRLHKAVESYQARNETKTVIFLMQAILEVERGSDEHAAYIQIANPRLHPDAQRLPPESIPGNFYEFRANRAMQTAAVLLEVFVVRVMILPADLPANFALNFASVVTNVVVRVVIFADFIWRPTSQSNSVAVRGELTMPRQQTR